MGLSNDTTTSGMYCVDPSWLKVISGYQTSTQTLSFSYAGMNWKAYCANSIIIKAVFTTYSIIFYFS